MPLLFTHAPSANTTFGVWQITETESFFRDNTPLTPAEDAELAPLKGERRLEWLAGRWLLHHLSGRDVRLPLAKDAFAKPFFPDETQLACSLSHSHGVVGALLARPAPPHPMAPACGCDLQVLVEKMPRLAPKFLRPEEVIFVGQHPAEQQFVLQHVFWTAKESLYKAYGLKALDFRAHLRVEPFAWRNDCGQTSGWVEKEEIRQTYRLFSALVRPEAAPPFVWTVALPPELP